MFFFFFFSGYIEEKKPYWGSIMGAMGEGESTTTMMEPIGDIECFSSLLLGWFLYFESFVRTCLLLIVNENITT